MMTAVEWELLGNIRGPAGPQGEQGPPGEPGEPGSDGEQGEPGEVTAAMLQAHIDGATPHPAYDVDLPSMTIIFENHLL